MASTNTMIAAEWAEVHSLWEPYGQRALSSFREDVVHYLAVHLKGHGKDGKGHGEGKGYGQDGKGSGKGNDKEWPKLGTIAQEEEWPKLGTIAKAYKR